MSKILPIIAICVIVLVATIGMARGKKNQVFDGIFVSVLQDGEFYPGATSCSVTGTPWWVHSSPEFAEATSFDVDSLFRRIQGVWRVRFVGDVTALGRYGKYWRVVTVKSVLKADKLDCKNIEEMYRYR